MMNGILIREVIQDDEKKKTARQILEALPDWFEVAEAREEYIRGSEGKTFFAAYRDQTPVGFLYLKETGKATVELAVMGVLKEAHRQGIGKALFLAAKDRAGKAGYEFMQVKTVQKGIYDDYDRTNLFYQSLGFREFEVIPVLWGKENPCQIYVMNLKAPDPAEKTDRPQTEEYHE